MIEININAGVAVMTMAYGKANALDLEFCAALVAEFGKLKNSDAHAVILTGQAKIFSAGVDLRRLSDGGADYIRKFLPALHRLYDAVFFHPKPIVCAINGHAIAGGAVLASCGDRRIMARDAGRIGITELQVGVPFPMLAFEIVRSMAPPRYLAEFTLGASTYASDVGLLKGWVDEVVEPSELVPRALVVAQQYAAISPPAYAQAKKQLRDPVRERLERTGEATDKAVTEIWTAPPTLAYIRDYVARTLKK
ncbi:MAG TPA: enoyl-CoA hydratase/isomerase family protein [Pseudolabrys sp.]|jgi:enoyl-CoA hydratase|nr:enoyl-CoA hydratase/isomerase family protein [Pseudolabrys sp.]